MDTMEILETLAAAKTYLQRLSDLENELKCAEDQVLTTYRDTENSIREKFHNLKTWILKVLENRESGVLKDAEKIKNEGLLPLQQCRSVILQKIDSTNKLIKLGESLSNGDHQNGITSFAAEASLLGSLPEVPELKEVPYITFSYECSSEDELETICSRFGDVNRIAPIQIMSLSAIPGGLIVEWQSVENEEKLRDIQEFRLQRAYGNVLKENQLATNFVDCYKGLDSQFYNKELQLDQQYSFRVCCKFEGAADWCPWSLVQVASTHMKHFCWRDTEGFLLTNDNKIAKKLNDIPAVLYSEEDLGFSYYHSVDITILDEDNKTDCCIGLVTKAQQGFKDLLECSDSVQSFLINRHGSIFIDGKEKGTKLPAFTPGLKISFTCESHTRSKIRISVDSSDKRVTYDWAVKYSKSSPILFACQLGSCDWKLMIE